MLKTAIRRAILTAACALSIAVQALADSPKQINVTAGDLTSALDQLGQQTGVEFVYSSEQLKGLHTKGVQGQLTAEKAVLKLLDGTNLTLTRHHSGALLIGPPNASSPSFSPTSRLQTQQDAAPYSEPAESTRPERPSANTERSYTSIETVLVTAQRREERLIDVPVSLSVLGPDEVARRGLVSREDYLRSVPAVSVRDDGIGLAEIVIRGAYGDSFRTGPTVGLYFRDVPLTGYALGASADVKLIDMQRVEVLRAPQGTLYGSNSLSGAIRYIPVEPDLREFSGSVRAMYSHTRGQGGSNDSIDGIVNIPLIDDELAVRAVAFRHGNAGYVKNVAGNDPALQAAAATYGATGLAINEEHLGDTEYVGGRVSALWQPLQELAIHLAYVRQVDSQDDRLFELRQIGPYLRSDYQLGAIVGGSDDAQRIDLDILNLTVNYQLPWGELYSSTAYMEQRFIRKWDIGALSLFGAPLKPINQISTTNADVLAQELRFTSSFDSPLQLVMGLYYEDSSQPTTQPTYFAGDPARNPYSAIKLWQIDLERDVEQKAAYGQLSYNLTERVKLTLGGRYFDYDSRHATRTFDTIILAPSASDDESSESGQTFKAGIELKPSDSTLIYANWSQGFRLGRPLATEFIRAVCDRNQDGLIDNTSISSNLERVDSDRLDNYEVGAKLSFLGGQALISSAVYQNDWADIPVAFSAPGCSTTLTLNGGTARARGVETEATFRFFDTLMLSLGLGYVQSELTSDTSLGRDGDELNYTPEFNGSLGLQYEFAIAQRTGYLRGDYTYFGSYYTQTGRQGIRADAYDLLSIRGGMFITPSSELLLQLDNVLDADDYTSVTGPSGFPPGYSVRLRPRTIGVGLNYRF
jgi:iron complex outermembrane recepter protein